MSRLVANRTLSPTLNQRSLLLSLLIVVSIAGVADAADDGREEFRQQIQPILQAHCYACHNQDRQEADLRLDRLNPDMVNGLDAETWHDVLNKLNLGEMPPDEKPQLPQADHGKITAWIRRELARAIAIKRSSGGRVVLRRLTRYEYANTMRDLLGLDADYAKNLPPESVSPDGFQNNGSVLRMSPLQLEYYLKTAREALAKVIVTGERPQLIKYHTEKSEQGKRKKQAVSNRLSGNASFLARLEEYPREGEIRVVVRAKAIVPSDGPFPRMQVSIGVRSDTVAPEKTLGVVDVVTAAEEFRDFEFRGRIEEFPLPGHNPKFPGVLITVRNITPAFREKGQSSKDKKGKAAKDAVADSDTMIEIESLDFEGPLYDAWPPTSHTSILFGAEESPNERQYVCEVLRRFMRRAYRRPITDAEVDLMAAFFDRVRPRATSFEDAVRDVLAMVLVSPEFLYLMEPRDRDAAAQPLTSFELASRLSYFLWSTMPDEELFDLAEKDTLGDSHVLAAQVKRMLSDPRSQQFVENFANQWLGLSGIDRVAVNPEYYPDFDDQLKADMRQETYAFLAWILDHDLNALTLLDADFAILNHSLAKHYGLAGPRSSRFEHVMLPADSQRGGLLTQGSMLLSNSTGEDSHPIKRAVWLLERLLDSPPPPPPPDVPDLSEEPDIAGLPLKRQLEVHRQKEACNNCHRGIDPWGIPFENFDAVGQWRTEVKRVVQRKTQRTPVVAVATLPTGPEITGMMELKRHLVENERERFARALTNKLLAYGLGRSVEFSDQDTVRRLSREFAEGGFRLRSLITMIVQSEEFRSK